MSLAAHFNTLGQTVIPQVFAAVMPDTCTITAETTSVVGGEQVRSGTTNAYTNIPCAVTPKTGRRIVVGDQITAVGDHIIELPTHYQLAGVPARINLNSTTHKIVVDARGHEPARTFRIEYPKNDNGVCFEVICTQE